MILAIVLSIAILVGFQVYFDATRPPPPEQSLISTQQTFGATKPTGQKSNLPDASGSAAVIPGTTIEQAEGLNRAEILARNNRETPAKQP